MHRYTLTFMGFLVGLLLAVPAMAQDTDPSTNPGNGSGICQFIDEDGDGFNDLAPDDDGDGIPNGLDPDYVPAQDGQAQQHQWRWVNGFFAKVFGISLDGEMSGYAYGSGENTGMAAGPGTGSGFGPGQISGSATGSGENQAEQAEHRGGRR